MRIITPSTGLRSKINWKNQMDRIYYVAKSESKKYSDLGLNIIEVPDGLCRAQVRKLVVENETEPFFMIDDDISDFTLFKYDYNFKMPIGKNISTQEACEIILEKIVENNLENKALVDFNNQYARLSCINGSKFNNTSCVFKAFYVNPKTLKELNLNFPDFDSQDDLELCLNLWELGNYPVKYSLLRGNLIYRNEEDSATWKNNKRTKMVCETYLRWGKVISLAPLWCSKQKTLRAKVSSTSLMKIVNNTPKGHKWNKIPEPRIKKLIEEKKYDELYDYICNKDKYEGFQF